MRIRFALILLIYATQFWTFGLPGVSVSIAGFWLAGIITSSSLLRLRYVWMLAAAAATSSILSGKDLYTPIIQYSFIFDVSTIFNIALGLGLVFYIRDSTQPILSRSIIYLAIIICFVSVAAVTPEALFGPVEGAVGFFNEKGLISYYLAYISTVLILYKKKRILDILVILCILIWCIFIIQGGRSIFYIIAIALLYIDTLATKKKILSILLISSGIIGILFTSFGDEQVLKFNLIQQGEGGVGRYAAAVLISRSEINDLLIGHGYGSYLGERLYAYGLPDGYPFDYAGSVLLELVFEIGLILTFIITIILTKYAFKRVTLFTAFATIFLLSFGVKHDVQMITGFIFSVHAYSIFRQRQIYRPNSTNNAFKEK